MLHKNIEDVPVSIDIDDSEFNYTEIEEHDDLELENTVPIKLDLLDE